MKILAIDTATEACSAALYIKGEVISRFELAPREHNRLILPLVESLLAEAGLSLNQLDGLAFGRGPGSFTGVRIATGVIQGLALGSELPVVGISTLAAMALDAFDEATDAGFAFPCIDARMSEVYWAVYRRNELNLASLVGEENVIPAEKICFPDDISGVGIGSGFETYQTVLTEKLEFRLAHIIKNRFPKASCIARLAVERFLRGEGVLPQAAQPVYLRDNVAKKAGGVR